MESPSTTFYLNIQEVNGIPAKRKSLHAEKVIIIPSLATMGPFSASAFLVSQKFEFSVAASLKCYP